MGSSLNGVDRCPYLVSLNLDEFIIGKPPIMSSNLDDHEPLIKNPSSSTPVIHVDPDTKPAYDDVWSDQMKNPLDYMMQNCGLRSVEEDFLQNPAPLMTKIDQEYLNWQQQQEMMDDSMKMQAEFRVFESGFDENKVTTTELVAENSGLEIKKNNNSNELVKDEMVMKSVERRQKRMMKNRESAARSRARKQDYINQLQQKVSQLQAWNTLLKKRKEAYALWNSNQISEPRYQLRRTTSAPF